MPFEKGQTPEGATPFQPGQSGNPAGRPQGSRNRSTVLRELLAVAAKYQIDGGEEKEGTIEDKLAAAQIKRALDGDTYAFKEIMDSVYGKLTEKTETNSTVRIEKAVVEVVPAGPPIPTDERENV